MKDGMRIQTFSIVVGNKACNARCPFCVSRMTGFEEVAGSVRDPINVINLAKACRLAEIGRTTTLLFTGKGEPTLFPEQISEYLQLVQPYNFPFIELQTNGLGFGWLVRDADSRVPSLDWNRVAYWYKQGLSTVALSVVSTKASENATVYHPDYPDLEKTVEFLHEVGFTVRLSVMMVKGFVDSPEAIGEVLDFCRNNSIEQCTVRPIHQPDNSRDSKASAFVRERGLSAKEVEDVETWVRQNGTRVMTLPYSTIYDVRGQNLALTDCLTVEGDTDNIRTLIFYHDGRVAYAWQYDGAVFLGGHKSK